MGGTLVVCPASLLSQWEKEVQDKCKRGLMSVQVYHGSNRENVPTRLAKNDIIITTYNIVAREYKTNSTLFKVFHNVKISLDFYITITRNIGFNRKLNFICRFIGKEQYSMRLI